MAVTIYSTDYQTSSWVSTDDRAIIYSPTYGVQMLLLLSKIRKYHCYRTHILIPTGLVSVFSHLCILRLSPIFLNAMVVNRVPGFSVFVRRTMNSPTLFITVYEVRLIAIYITKWELSWLELLYSVLVLRIVLDE